MKINKLILFALSAIAVIGCNDLKDIENRVDSLESRIEALESITSTLNANIEALQTLQNATTINKVEQNGDIYTITLSNGDIITLDQGTIGVAAAPVMSVDNEGYWMVDYDGEGGDAPEYILVNGEKVQAVGKDAVSPKFKVDLDGFWMVSYDGGANYEYVCDSDGNKVSAKGGSGSSGAQDPFFEDISYANDMLTVILRGGTKVQLPIIPDFLCAIQKEGEEEEEVFEFGETKSYNVEMKGIASHMVIAPNGWAATLAGNTLTVKAPATATKTSIDSDKDVCILAVSEHGYSTIAKIKVILSSEVVPVITDLYAAYEEGTEIIIAGQPFTKADDTEAICLKSSENPNIASFIHEKGSETVSKLILFLEQDDETGFTISTFKGILEGAETDINTAKVNTGCDLVITSRHTDSPVTITPSNSSLTIGGNFIFNNLVMDMTNVSGYFMNSANIKADQEYYIVNGCKVLNVKKPFIYYNSPNFAFRNVLITDNIFDIEAGGIQFFNFGSAVYIEKFLKVAFDNNIVMTKTAGGFGITIFNYNNPGNGVHENGCAMELSICQNTFYNMRSQNPIFRLYDIKSCTMQWNIFCDTRNDAANAAYFLQLFNKTPATEPVLNVSDNICFGLKYWALAHSNGYWIHDTDENGDNVDRPISANVAENPLETADLDNFVFTPKAEYKDYGYQK